MTKNAGIDKYGYSGYGIGFDRHGSFSFLGIGLARNVITFEEDMSSSIKIDNRKKTHIDFGQRSNKRIGTYTERRKNVFD